MKTINLETQNINVSEAMKEHIDSTFSKAINHFETHIKENISLILSLDSSKFKATLRIPIAGNDIVLKEEGRDMYKVIASISQKMNRSLRKKKEILTNN
jgi:putative sigma-54 modulation protein